MPKKKRKPAHDLTTEEALERLFPKRVREELHKTAEHPVPKKQVGNGKSTS